MVDYWDNMFKTSPEIPTKGLLTAASKTNLARDGVLQRIKAPTLVMTADNSKMQSVENAREYQKLIPNSRLAVLLSDGYHIAASNADECVTHQGGETPGLAARLPAGTQGMTPRKASPRVPRQTLSQSKKGSKSSKCHREHFSAA